MTMYRKTTLLEVVKEGPQNSMVREAGPGRKIFLMPTQDLRDMYEEVKKQELDKNSGYKLEY